MYNLASPSNLWGLPHLVTTKCGWVGSFGPPALNPVTLSYEFTFFKNVFKKSKLLESIFLFENLLFSKSYFEKYVFLASTHTSEYTSPTMPTGQLASASSPDPYLAPRKGLRSIFPQGAQTNFWKTDYFFANFGQVWLKIDIFQIKISQLINCYKVENTTGISAL